MSESASNYQDYSVAGYVADNLYENVKPSESYKNEVLNELSLPPGAFVLDMSSGVGNEARQIKQKFGAKVFETDLSPVAYSSGSSVDRNFTISRVEHQPFADGSFDLVHSKDFAPHLADLSPLFKEAYRLIKDDGKFLLTSHIGNEFDSLPFFSFDVKQDGKLIHSGIYQMQKSDLPYPETVKLLREQLLPNEELYVRSPMFLRNEYEIESVAQTVGFEKENEFFWTPNQEEQNWNHNPRVVFIFKKLKK
jgi:SAM-dependent methyltransferase